MPFHLILLDAAVVDDPPAIETGAFWHFSHVFWGHCAATTSSYYHCILFQLNGCLCIVDVETACGVLCFWQ